MRKIVYESTEFYDSLLIVGPLWFLAYIVFSGFPDLDRFVAGAFYQGRERWVGNHLSFLNAVPEWGGWLIPLMAVSIALVFYAVSLWQGDAGKSYVWRNHLLYLAGTVSACIFVVGLCRYFSPGYGPSDLTVYGGVLSGIGRCFLSVCPVFRFPGYVSTAGTAGSVRRPVFRRVIYPDGNGER